MWTQTDPEVVDMLTLNPPKIHFFLSTVKGIPTFRALLSLQDNG